MTDSLTPASQTLARPTLEIKTLGDPILRSTAETVTDFTDPALQQLIDQLIATTQMRNGVGIAAPQVGLSVQLMIVASHPTPRYPHAPEMPPIAMINPQIIWASPDMESDWEGCLSVPGQRGLVPRHREIQIEYTDRTGQRQQCDFSGFVARIFQHEYDHFQGIVFLDRVAQASDIISEADYQAMLDQTDA
jgi:peptide deformylase